MSLDVWVVSEWKAIQANGSSWPPSPFFKKVEGEQVVTAVPKTLLAFVACEEKKKEDQSLGFPITNDVYVL